MGASAGYKSRMAAGANPVTFGSGTERWDITDCDIGVREELLFSKGITGTRTGYIQQQSAGNYQIGGGFKVEPSYAFLRSWLPRILGAAASGTTYATADTVPAWDCLLDHVGRVDRFINCKVNKAVWEISPKGLTTLSIDSMGISVDEGGTSWASAALQTTADYAKIAWRNCTWINQTSASTIAFRKATLTIENHLESLPAPGQATPGEIFEADTRTVSLSMVFPNTSGNLTALWNTVVGSTANGASVLGATATGLSLAISINNLQAPRMTPKIGGKGEVVFDWAARGLSDLAGGAVDINVVLDSTP